MKKQVAVFLLALMPLFVEAQNETKKIDLTLSLTGNIYQGDLTPSILGSTKDLKPGFSGMLRYHVKDDRVYLRGLLNVASLKGDDAQFTDPEWSKNRNYSFTSSLIDVAAMIEYNLNKDDKKFQPFFSFGFGFAKINPIKDASKIDTNYYAPSTPEQLGLIKEKSITQPKLIITIPVSVGFRYKINTNAYLFLEACYRSCITDYLDGFSQSVRSQKFDGYSVYSLGYTFKLNGDHKK